MIKAGSWGEGEIVKQESFTTLFEDGKTDFIQEGLLQWGFVVGERDCARM